MSRKTVFLSYRRDAAGKAFARLIEQALTHRGYDVFLDVDSMEPGRWEQQLRLEVPQRAHFLLLLTPGALARCADDDDWVRREYELAVRHNCNVVPVREESFDTDRERAACPESMRRVFDWQMATVGHASFKGDIDELVSRFIPPHKAPSDESAVSDRSEPSSSRAERRIAPTKLPAGGKVLIGRSKERRRLTTALKSSKTHIVSIVAWGGTGKSALTANWMAGLAKRNWPGIDRYFDWSFYSQGTRGEQGTSADVFIAKALKFFGDPDPQAGSPHDRGDRLARLVAERPALLILDGLEPMQFGPGPQEGEIKDAALKSLLKGIVQRPFSGLCVITTREPVKSLEPFLDQTVVEMPLRNLSEPAGAELLHHLGVTRAGAKPQISRDDPELHAASREVTGHALTLQLMGTYLKRAHGGDVRRRDRFGFEPAMRTASDEHAFKVIAVYERWLSGQLEQHDDVQQQYDCEQGEQMLSVLRMLGLFDRPAQPDSLSALRGAPVIPGLNDPVADVPDDDWNSALVHLEELGLISLAVSDTSGSGLPSEKVVDSHPLLREYFAHQLREERPTAWTEGHRRLYEHLCEATKPHQPDTLDGLQPLYQAVAHGCQAGLHQRACDDVYIDRILRATGSGGNYSAFKLGAIGADLGAVACFFHRPWSGLTPNLAAANQAWLLNEAAFRLRALGRLTEAAEPMRAALEMRIEQENWKSAAICAGNLSELELTLGEVAAALADAGQSVTFADRSGDVFQQSSKRTTHADALHQAGRRDEAGRLFADAETMQGEDQPTYPRLYSLPGVRYCDLLLSGAERAAWQLQFAPSPQARPGERPSADPSPRLEVIQACDHVTQRATQTLEWGTGQQSLLTTALDHLTLGRAALYRWLAEGAEPRAEGRDSGTLGPCPSALSQNIAVAVDGLREAGQMDDLPRGLLTRALQRQLTGDAAGAASDLDEAWEIAERGPMPLYQADILLTRARLFFRDDLAKAKKDLAAARGLIKEHGYHRRDEELQDAEAAILHTESR